MMFLETEHRTNITPLNAPAAKSRPMLLAEGLGLGKLAWSLRRLHCPVKADALVLEVGAGGNPYPRANVLLDAYQVSPERMETDLVNDRPLIIGRCEDLPFADDSFDFIIASHVLEHSPDPDRFLRELMRVGRGGYIETPEAFYERIDPFMFHRLEVAEGDGKLLITKKPRWDPEPGIRALYARQLKQSRFFRAGSSWPEALAVRYYWTKEIEYRISNPSVDCAWALPSIAESASPPPGRILLRELTRALFSQRRRNRQLDVVPILRCIQCNQAACIRMSADVVQCGRCGCEYRITGGAIVMDASAA
jgi:SAM-dependent methyltransferase